MILLTRVEEVNLGHTKIWLGEDGILRILFYPKTEIDIVKAREVGAALVDVCAGKRRLVFADARNIKSISREAREYWATDEATKWSIAVATLYTPVLKVLAGFYLKFNKPPFPIRFFTSETDAIAWLQGFMQQV